MLVEMRMFKQSKSIAITVNAIIEAHEVVDVFLRHPQHTYAGNTDLHRFPLIVLPVDHFALFIHFISIVSLYGQS